MHNEGLSRIMFVSSSLRRQHLEASHQAAAQGAQRQHRRGAQGPAAAVLCLGQMLGAVQAQAVAAGRDGHLKARVEADGAACREGGDRSQQTVVAGWLRGCAANLSRAGTAGPQLCA